MSNKEWAHACAARGWLVFPSRAKRPLVRWGTHSTTDPERIERWWEEWPDADVCIKTGSESGLVVVDWDAYKQEDPSAWPLDTYVQTYEARTAKGGYHLYYRHPGFPVSNSAGLLAQYVDVRGDGGMVVAYPPVYDHPLAPLPDGWAQPRQRGPVNQDIDLTPAFSYKGPRPMFESLLLNALAEVRWAPEGKRNFILYSQASDMYRNVWYGNLDKEDVTQRMGDQALAIGLEPHEIAATLASAMRNAASQVEQERTK